MKNYNAKFKTIYFCHPGLDPGSRGLLTMGILTLDPCFRRDDSQNQIASYSLICYTFSVILLRRKGKYV